MQQLFTVCSDRPALRAQLTESLGGSILKMSKDGTDRECQEEKLDRRISRIMQTAAEDFFTPRKLLKRSSHDRESRALCSCTFNLHH